MSKAERTVEANAKRFNINNIYYKVTSETERTVEVTIISDKYEPQNLGGLSSKIFVKDHTFANDYTGKIEIPSTVNYNNTEYRVTAISNFAFINCTGLTSIIIPEGVKSIGGGAFFGCSLYKPKGFYNSKQCNNN